MTTKPSMKPNYPQREPDYCNLLCILQFACSAFSICTIPDRHGEPQRQISHACKILSIINILYT